jgi:hypothetical protein
VFLHHLALRVDPYDFIESDDALDFYAADLSQPNPNLWRLVDGYRNRQYPLE